MEMAINKFNDAGESHGYWGGDNNECHYFNGLNVGLEITSTVRCHHHLSGKEIGCEVFYTNQYFYNSKGNIFGEQIEWN